ncbi:isochorismatase family protein [Teladorsagia circumcincta]|uniref:Isochorismatase domain-containing protein 1 n=1 Tax=Teladorsagia circumcincta TaxID=45464 RepID=A0A2G9U4Z7_TELCI|nr:isochorismatase family protein [Teladorsagia circumcincta]
MLTRLVPRLDIKKTLLFVCDMQEKFSKTNKFFPEIAQTAKRIVDSANILQIPIIVTEHYPKGLGPTVSELGLDSTVTRYPKTQFSMCIPEVVPFLENKESVILVGLEAHVCILHTTYALIERGFDVHVVVDAVTARTHVDRKFGFKQLERVGAVLTTSECVLMGLLKGAAHPKFKEIQKIVMTEAPDSGLMDL